MSDVPAPAPAPDSGSGSGLVVAALSGGVDSAVAAALLVEAGHRVAGMTMRLYDARGTRAGSGRCCGPRDIDDARAVCAHLGIPHYVIDLEAAFTREVVDDFVEAYLAGETPNPCVKCNQHIKFTPLLQRARAVGADVLATGHYARLEPDGTGGVALRRGVDAGKDQSYFLFSMPTHELAAVRFPLGGMRKDEVRAHARRLGLPNAGKHESQEICFVPDGDHAGFVAAQALRRGRALPMAGAILDEAGTVLGQHDGTHRFTLGQHRGLGNLAAPGLGAPKDRLFVTAIDPAEGTVRVGPRAAAERHAVALRDVRWFGPAPTSPIACRAQVRHRGEPVAATVHARADLAHADLAVPMVAAPGQAVVFYDDDRVLGGGWVTATASR